MEKWKTKSRSPNFPPPRVDISKNQKNHGGEAIAPPAVAAALRAAARMTSTSSVTFLIEATRPESVVDAGTMGGKTHGMVAGQPDDKCIAMCVKGTSSQYALNDGKTVLKLSDQKTLGT
jgi:hypothetical protein